MEQNIVIYIGIYKALGLIGTIILGAWYASSRLTRVETKVDTFETRFTNLEGRMDLSFGNKSPIALLAKGQTILEDSGLKKYIDDKKDNLLTQCRSKNTMTNQYDIQNSSFKFFDELNFGDFEVDLKTSAYKYGVSMDTIRRIGGIYFRDICLKEAGFDPKDLDKPKTP